MALTEERMKELDEAAFEMFARAYPHEAAKLDWQRFVAFTQKVNPNIPESAIRSMLEITKDDDTSDAVPADSQSPQS